MTRPSTRAELLAFISADAVLADLLARVRVQDGPPDPAHDAEHVLRVALWTLHLAPAEVSAREAICAALLHDVVNVPKNSPDRARASELSAERAAQWLTPTLGKEATSRVADAIRDHSYSRGRVPTSPLGRALQDADRLEALGAIGIMRCISTGAKMGATYFHVDDPWATARTLDDRAYSIDHFFTKLLGLAETMCTEQGRAEARTRTQLLRAFVDSLAHEIGTPRA